MLTKRWTAISLLVAAAAGMSSCQTSSSLHDANTQLATLYQQAANASSDAMLRVNARAALASLGTDSAARADKAADDATRISFYRIAVTAGWQSQSPTSDMLDWADRGTALCNQNGNAAKVPRDCGMLMIFPLFAAMDELTLDWNAATATSASTVAQLNDTWNGYANLLAKLAEQRTAIAALDADPLLLEGVDQRAGKALCANMYPLVGTAILTAGGGQPLQQQFACRAKSLLQSLKTAGVDPNAGTLTDAYSCAAELDGWTGC
jgi:hypothetical protein